MNIGIDARMYGPKVGGGGLGRYVEQLIIELQKINREHRFVLFLKKENFDACRITNPFFEKRLADIHWYTLEEQLKMPKLIDKENLDLMHFPHWNVPLFSKTPFVVTIHDLILLDEPRSAKITTRHPLYFLLKTIAYKKVLRHAVKKSENIIAVSNFTRNSILKHFPSTEEKKVKTIYEGLTQFDSTKQEALPTSITNPYLLYIGNAYPHKNLSFLINTFAEIQSEHKNLQLVLAGRGDVFYERLKSHTKKLQLPEHRVLFISSPNDELVETLYENATAYVFPSRIEGFGLPPLEAMSKDIPVLSSNTSCLPEILEDAALYFSPSNKEELKTQIKKILSDEAIKKTLIKKGREQIQKYSWEKMARSILGLYETD